MIPQVRRRDGGDGVHAVPQDSGNPGNIWLLILDAVFLLHRRQTAVRDDWPVRPPDVQPDVSILVRTIHFSSHFCVLVMRWKMQVQHETVRQVGRRYCFSSLHRCHRRRRLGRLCIAILVAFRGAKGT